MDLQPAPAALRVLLLVGDDDGDVPSGRDPLAARLRAAGMEVVAVAASATPDAAVVADATFAVVDPAVPADAPAVGALLGAGVPLLEALSPTATAGEAQLRRLDQLHARLLAARRMEVVGRLVGGVAHDFNNVLSVVTTLSELLLRFGSDDDPDREDLEEILAAAQRGSELTRQLQAFTRVDVGEAQRVAVSDRLRHAEKLIRKLLPEDISVVVQYEEAVPDAWLDPVEVDQILFNLTAHGRWALNGGGSLRLATEAGPDGRPRVVMDLAARPASAMPLAADPAGLEGAGPLGLVSVDEIVGRRQGRLVVEEQGSRARRLEVHLPPAPDPPVEPEAEELPAAWGNGRRLLVVEDDERVREAVARLLQSLAFEVEAATNGGEALAAIRRHRPHGVVCASVLRDAWGTELREQAGGETPEVPFLFLSGHEEHPAVEVARRSGCPVLRKPVAGEELARALHRLLGAGSG